MSQVIVRQLAPLIFPSSCLLGLGTPETQLYIDERCAQCLQTSFDNVSAGALRFIIHLFIYLLATLHRVVLQEILRGHKASVARGK